MYRNDRLAIRVHLDLPNELYVFDSESAAGKTYLFKQLRTMQLAGEPVFTYTYEDKLLGLKLEERLVPGKFKVIMLDRYDMYFGECAEILKKCREGAIVLVDSKDVNALPFYGEWCMIERAPDLIEVTL